MIYTNKQNSDTGCKYRQNLEISAEEVNLKVTWEIFKTAFKHPQKQQCLPTLQKIKTCFHKQRVAGDWLCLCQETTGENISKSFHSKMFHYFCMNKMWGERRGSFCHVAAKAHLCSAGRKPCFHSTWTLFLLFLSFVNLSLIFLLCFGFIEHALKLSINAPNVTITLWKKHTVFWGKANTITEGISYTFSSLFSKHHIRSKKECVGEEKTSPTAHQMHSVFSDPYYCFLTALCKYCMRPYKQCFKHEAQHRGSHTKRKGNKALPWDK